ncbi:BSCL2 [Blepharisma stoltei]|uniref:Seipin n=1 Tax=Blepharisma stoltei TaxID=1481888 RepID=A0AAU9IT62_9CILI|nr:unnamed protein product [Blepharisma stoltei]
MKTIHKKLLSIWFHNPAENVSNFFKGIVSNTIQASRSAATTSFSYALRVFLISALFFSLFIAAGILYGSAYYFFMPYSFQKIPISLHSSLLDKRGSVIVGQEIILENENYLASVLFELPESPENFDCGNFDVEVLLDDEIKAKGIGIMKYYSPVIRMLRSFLKAFLIVTGLIDESQSVKVSLPLSITDASNFEKLEIKVSPKNLQVYSAWLYLEVQLTGVRFLAFHYFYTCLIVGTLSLFTFEISGIVCYILYLKYVKKVSGFALKFIPEEFLCPKIQKETLAIEEFPTDFSHILKPAPPKKEKLIKKLKHQLVKLKNELKFS